METKIQFKLLAPLLHISEWTWTSCIIRWTLDSSSVKQRWRSRNIHLPGHCVHYMITRLEPRTWPVLIDSCWPPASCIYPNYDFHNQPWFSSYVSLMDTKAERVRLLSSSTAALSASSLISALPVTIKPKTPKIVCKHEAAAASRPGIFFYHL